MREVEIANLLAYELGEGDLGTEHKFNGFAAHVADTPIGHSLASLLHSSANDGLPGLYKRFAIWIIPHRLSLVRRKGLWEPISVGLEVEYQNGAKTCSVLGLFPSYEFHKVGGVGFSFSATADAGGNLSVSDPTSTDAQVQDLGHLKIGARTSGKLGINLECQVATPRVMAVGVGSTRCEWRFDVNDSPLYGKDLETWSLIALPKSQKELKYKMRFYVVTRIAFVPQRFESAWEEVTCQLPT